jgi:hypothetical protein
LAAAIPGLTNAAGEQLFREGKIQQDADGRWTLV